MRNYLTFRELKEEEKKEKSRYQAIVYGEVFVKSLTKKQLLSFCKEITMAAANGEHETMIWSLSHRGAKGPPFSWERWFHKRMQNHLDDPRLNKKWKIIKCGRGSENDKELGVATLINKIGPGHFIAMMDGNPIEVYSAQLRKFKNV